MKRLYNTPLGPVETEKLFASYSDVHRGQRMSYVLYCVFLDDGCCKPEKKPNPKPYINDRRSMRKSKGHSALYLGQRVRVNDTITTRYIGREGTVINVEPSRHATAKNTTLDKYTVAFSDDDQAGFFDQSIGERIGR